MMYYGGESNVPGAPGNVGQFMIAGGNFMGGQGSAINPDLLRRDSRQQKIYNKGVGTDNPFEKETFLKRTGPQLPPLAGTSNMSNALLSLGPNIIGNIAGMQSAALAQNPVNIPNIRGF